MRVLTVIPTYNEKENLPVVVERLRKAAPEVDILVVDDNSPDGTGQIADDMAPKPTYCTAPSKTASAAHTSQDSTGASPKATKYSSKWMPTAPTSPSSCPHSCAP